MITKIKTIKNIGKFENYNGNQKIEKNQVIFGFNGSGKSTISDILYSLANNQVIDKNRKTLDKDDGHQSGEMSVGIETDDGDLVYNEETCWNKTEKIYTFNSKYIKNNMLIEGDLTNLERADITFGKKSVDLKKKKDKTIDKINSCFELINEFINSNKQTMEDLGLPKTKLKIDTKKLEDKLSLISNVELLPTANKEKELNKLNTIFADSRELELIKGIENKIKLVHLTDLIVDIKLLEKTLKVIPNITQRELNSHMTNYMKTNGMNWLIEGFVNQKDQSICPFCGQELKTKDSKKLIKNINKYIVNKTNKKAKTIQFNIDALINTFNVSKMKANLELVYALLEDEFILSCLTMKQKNFLQHDEFDIRYISDILIGLNNKLWVKSRNVYLSISVTDDEINVIKHIIKVINIFNTFIVHVDKIKRNKEDNLKKEKIYKQQKALISLSYDEKRENYKNVKNASNEIKASLKELDELDYQISDLKINVHLDKVNEILNSLNIKFNILVEKKKYFIKLKDYVKQDFNKETLFCSEGEIKILAFAYFLSEISMFQGKKTIVIDDPVTSLDLSRKSVVAYRIKELFYDDNSQVILLTHDLSFVEKIKDYVSKDTNINYLEMINESHSFRKLKLEDYIVDDKEVYRHFINTVNGASSEVDRLVALMSLRPLVYLTDKSKYEDVEKNSSYFAHTLYAKNNRIHFDENKYDENSLKNYINQVNEAIDSDFDNTKLVLDGYNFKGFEYNNIKRFYENITVNNVYDARKKALVLRIMLEACLFKLVDKTKLDIEHIGNEYGKAIRGAKKERKKFVVKLKELYDLSKKYHHGGENGSMLGLAYINPEELEFIDKQLKEITNWIDLNIIS